MKLKLHQPSSIDVNVIKDGIEYDLLFYKKRKYCRAHVVSVESAAGRELSKAVLLIDQNGHITLESLDERTTPAADRPEGT